MRLEYTPTYKKNRFVIDEVPLSAGESTTVSERRGRELVENYPGQFVLEAEPDSEPETGGEPDPLVAIASPSKKGFEKPSVSSPSSAEPTTGIAPAETGADS